MDAEKTDSEQTPDASESSDSEAASSRREFIGRSIRRAAYVAPVVLLFKPREAVAGSGGSAITPGP